jgi:hypothetical protein
MLTRDDIPVRFSTHRPRFLALIGVLAATAMLVAACGGGAGTADAPRAAGTQAEGSQTVVTLYRTPTCGCCIRYADYLEEHGFQVETVVQEDLSELKERLGVPEAMHACHTAIIGDYFVEGHVPVEAIQRLLEERPDVDGIAVPGMPAGSPGMSGELQGSLVVYAITDGAYEQFLRLAKP